MKLKKKSIRKKETKFEPTELTCQTQNIENKIKQITKSNPQSTQY